MAMAEKNIDYDAIRQELSEERIFFTDHPEVLKMVEGKSKEEKLRLLNGKINEWECEGWANLDMALKGCFIEGKMKMANVW